MTPEILFLAAQLATAAIPAKVTVEGCVANEAEISDRKPGFGERTGLDQHFVLVNGTVVKGKAPGAAPAGDTGVPTPLSPTFRLHGLTDEQVKLHVGHRVRVEGRFGPPDATASGGSGKDLVQLDVATIRQVPGDCSGPRR
jgi:hypothetical protein